MASKAKTVKVAYDFDPQVKHTLSMLKADLRLRGIAATETGILEVMIVGARIDKLGKAYLAHFST